MTTPLEDRFVLTLDDVLGVYRKVLPSGTLLVNGFFTRVVATVDGTSAIAKDGTFYYCPAWYKEWITTPGRLQDIVMHELMHPSLGDFAREDHSLSNLAGDCVINSMLFTLQLSPCELFQAFYQSTRDPDCLLRPRSNPSPKFGGLYKSLYPTIVSGKADALNPLEVLHALQILYDEEEPEVKLIGSHGTPGGSPTTTVAGESIQPIDISIPANVSGDLNNKLADIGEKILGAGYSDYLNQTVFPTLKVKEDLRLETLKDFAWKNDLNRLRQQFEAKGERRSVVPITLSRNDAAKIAMGFPPLFYNVHNAREESLEGEGMWFYVDVSGSVYSKLPYIMGLFAGLKNCIKEVLAFSNKVAVTSIDDFAAGRVETTGGTDFNCVIQHALEHKVRKLVLLTDGEAGVTPELQIAARREIPRIGIVYFGDYVNHDNWIEQQYGIAHRIEDLVHLREGT